MGLGLGTGGIPPRVAHLLREVELQDVDVAQILGPQRRLIGLGVEVGGRLRVRVRAVGIRLESEVVLGVREYSGRSAACFAVGPVGRRPQPPKRQIRQVIASPKGLGVGARGRG